MYKAQVLLIILFILSIVSVSSAFNVIYVDVNGPNDPGTGTFDDPFLRIQDALDVAIDGDIVEIRPGIYTADPNNYNLDPNGKSITIRSIEPNDPNIIANTIIDPNGAGRGFYFHSGEDANCVISGLTIRNAQIAEGYGGGIYCDGSSPTIVNCTITDNSALLGGAVYCYDSNSEFKSCTINNNYSTGDGAGLECWWGNPKLTNCIISNNQASGNGGGIDCWYYGNPILTNCTIAKNSASSGGGVYCDNSELIVRSSILWANDSNMGEQLALVNNGSASVSYCDVQGGQAEVYVETGCTLSWEDNNISLDPNFGSFDPNGEPNTWDFHLQSAYGRWDPNVQSWVTDSNTSPCIDAGDPNLDWSSEPWPNGRRINMGAYGGTNQASMKGNAADFDVSGAVNFVDFAEFSDKWRLEGSFIEDLSGNGVVEFVDLRMFAEDWLWQRQ